MAQKEAKARLKINMLLSDAGWRLVDDEGGPANVDVENRVDIENPGDDFENTRKGMRISIPTIAVIIRRNNKSHPLSRRHRFI